MFKSISWQAYLQFMAIGTGIFYCVVILVYYRKETLSLIKRVLAPKHNRQLLSTVDSTPHTEILQQKLDDLRGVFFRAGNECSKEDLFNALEHSLADYDSLHLPLHQDALILFISTQAMQICGLEVSDQEIKHRLPALAQ